LSPSSFHCICRSWASSSSFVAAPGAGHLLLQFLHLPILLLCDGIQFWQNPMNPINMLKSECKRGLSNPLRASCLD
jgi:hypothetical protein